MTVELKVLEAYTRDVGRGIIRIDYDTMDKLNISTGDPIRVTAKGKSTVSKALPLYPSDEGKEICRLDGCGRNNCVSEVGTLVKLEKVKKHTSSKVIVTPLEAIPPIDERYLSDALESVYVSKDDTVVVPYFGGRLNFKVVKATPNESRITQKTIFNIAEKTTNSHSCPTCGHTPEEDDDRMKWIKGIMNMALKVDWNDPDSQGIFAHFLGELWDTLEKDDS
jgi:transitional endoplasmic reticulum ATPase